MWAVPASGGMPIDRTPKLDGSALRLTADRRGNVWVFVNRGVQTEVDAFRDSQLVTSFRWSDGIVDLPIFPELASAPARLAFTVGDPGHTDNVAVADGEGLRKITAEGDDQLAKA